MIDILLIDDNRDLLHLTAEVLRSHGLTVQTADTAASGLARAKEFQPHAILCDLSLPDQSGFELAHQLREDFGAKPLYLVGFTARSVRVLQGSVDTTPFDQFLSKPLTGDKIRTLIQTIRERSGQA